jgi:UDP-glucose-4-epimerase GalE
MRIVVTGGAGYIGSHMTALLVERGHEAIVVDDLSAGHRDAIAKGATLIEARVSDSKMRDACKGADAVIHFAGLIQVGESVAHPRKYWEGNFVESLAALHAAIAAKVPVLVFSSTAAVYGTPDVVPIVEDHPKRPINPYGASKLAFENALVDYGRAYGIAWAALRYFNAAGAFGGLRERHEPETHLIPLAVAAAKRLGPPLELFGTDWRTPDKTCIRDYVHVRDLALAHLAAIDHLRKGGASDAFNIGTGRGASVREVIAAVEAATGATIPVIESPRRAGDPESLVASVDKASRVLGWSAQSSLREIAESVA